MSELCFFNVDILQLFNCSKNKKRLELSYLFVFIDLLKIIRAVDNYPLDNKSHF